MQTKLNEPHTDMSYRNPAIEQKLPICTYRQQPLSSSIKTPIVDSRFIEIFDHAEDPTNPKELRELWLGRLEEELGSKLRESSAKYWRQSKRKQSFSSEEILRSPGTIGLVKELFNTFFRDDLYGALRSEAQIILSTGTAAEKTFGLPEVLKSAIRFAIDDDLYGYSNSLGREESRDAIAQFENERMGASTYSKNSVAITVGATHAISSIADLLLRGNASLEPVLCAIPNYPPLVASVARHHETTLVPLSVTGDKVSLRPLIESLTSRTPMILLQSVINPFGLQVDMNELAELIERASPSTIIVLDESHECLGSHNIPIINRTSRNLVRVVSLSKSFSVPGLKVGWLLADETIIKEFYEYASTTFGGPPSVFSSFVEVLAIFELWRIQEASGSCQPTIASSMKENYSFTEDSLNSAFRSYKNNMGRREHSLVWSRDFVSSSLSAAGFQVVQPRYSLNVLCSIDDDTDSYSSFRRILADTGVAVYPSLLNFFFSGSAFRITCGIEPKKLFDAVTRLKNYSQVTSYD